MERTKRQNGKDKKIKREETERRHKREWRKREKTKYQVEGDK